MAEANKSLIGSIVGIRLPKIPKPGGSWVLPSQQIGLEVELQNWDGQNRVTEFWTNHTDESLRNNGQEFILARPTMGEDLSEAIDAMCEEAIRSKYDIGFPHASIHVHIDCTDLDVSKKHLVNLTSLYLLIEHAMFRWAGHWRRSCGFCEPLNTAKFDFPRLAKVLYKTIDQDYLPSHFVDNITRLHKYQAINYMPLADKGTIEFRHLPTTFDPARIKTWVNFVMQLKKSAMQPLDLSGISYKSRWELLNFLSETFGKTMEPLYPLLENTELKIAQANIAALAVPVREVESPARIRDWNSIGWGRTNPLLRLKEAKSTKREKPSKVIPPDREVGRLVPGREGPRMTLTNLTNWNLQFRDSVITQMFNTFGRDGLADHFVDNPTTMSLTFVAAADNTSYRITISRDDVARVTAEYIRLGLYLD